ncbi:MAG: Z1 domain-containing protein [Clostridium sp.]|nr:Z1 domain-containing protein [Clostridium sp.]
MNTGKKLYNLVISFIVMQDINQEEKIEEAIENISQLLSLSEVVTEEDKKYVKNKVMAERSIKLKEGSLIKSNEKFEKWFLGKKSELSMDYWERYKKYLLEEKNFAINVVNTMDDMLDNLTDLLGNPKSECGFQRRGLIIGDVQSGKTSNYTGLLCKGADAGYEVIVLLTGTIEKLRKQTQLRLDEGFVGMDSSAMIKQKENNVIGVGKYNPSVHPLVLTSTANDFRTSIANNLSIKIGPNYPPLLFVIKKNVSTLKNLNKWLKISNQNSDNKINLSLLVIDDESDNASVNTNAEDRDPTTINGQIRELLNLFDRASYVGFTATPFANIFIDPESNDKMENEDLFPKDYIYCLNAPTNYIGARDIFGEDGKYKYMLREIDKDSIELHIPYKHKSDYVIDAMPLDMQEAINAFLLANVIRDLRGDGNKHRSMLINVSRFTNVQVGLMHLVNNYVKEVQASARLNGQLDSNIAIANSTYIKSLKCVFDKQYSSLEFNWDEVLKNLYKGIASVVVVTVNQRNKNGLNYEDYESTGLRVIAIGGLSLSRGLTLEGLIISYFYRNSKMYDTLMQMGRWFGYRYKYDDLCRIWMEKESIEWYEQINEATEELRRDIKKYENSGLTPKDFGIRVRSDINTLLVTARNKMRTASNMEVCISLSGQVIETPCIYNDYEFNRMNMESINSLVSKLVRNGYAIEDVSKSSNKTIYGFRNVDKLFIKDLLNDFRVSILNNAFNCESINEFIDSYDGYELNKWDIVFASGISNKTYKLLDKEIPMITRGYELSNNGKIIKLSGKKKRLGSPNDGAYCLTDEQIDNIKKKYEIYNEKKANTLSQKHYFMYCNDRNPLIVVYYVELKEKDEYKLDKDKKKIEECVVGLSIGIPELKKATSCFAKYKINKVLQELATLGEEIDFGDEE